MPRAFQITFIVPVIPAPAFILMIGGPCENGQNRTLRHYGARSDLILSLPSLSARKSGGVSLSPREKRYVRAAHRRQSKARHSGTIHLEIINIRLRARLRCPLSAVPAGLSRAALQ